MIKKILTIFICALAFCLSGHAQAQPGTNADPNTRSKGSIEFDLDNIIKAANGNTGSSSGLPKIGYADYIIERDRYKADPNARQPYLGYIPGCDSFFKFKVPVMMAKNIEGLKAKLVEDERTKERMPAALPTIIERQEQQVDNYSRYLMPGHPLLVQLADLKAKMEKLSASSAVSANNKEFPKAGSSNPTWEAAASSAVTNMRGSGSDTKILKAVTTTSTWAIKKNEVDVPIYRYQWVAVGYSEGGKCYVRLVDVQQTYAGGGTWNTGYSYLPAGVKDEIPCSKIQ